MSGNEIDRTRQLPFDFPVMTALGREDFLPSPCNQTALAWIDRWPDWPTRELAVIGPAGAGKTHLAAIWAQSTGARMLSAEQLSVDRLPELLPEGCLIVEDADRRLHDQVAAFHLLNLARERRAFLLFTGREKPTSWPVSIKDLHSRLRAISIVDLGRPDDSLLAAVMQKIFSDRQLHVEPHVVDYLVKRMERSLMAAQQLVEILDQLSLSENRPINRTTAADALTQLAAQRPHDATGVG